MGTRSLTKGVVIEDGNIDKLDELAQAAIRKKIRTNPLLDLKRMRTNLFFDPKPITDLSRTLGKNLLVGDELVSPAYYKVAKSVAETRSKVREPKTLDKAINVVVYGNRWQEAINEEL